MADDWRPWTKWYMDIAKSIITFVVVTLVAIAVLNRLEERRLQKRFQEQQSFTGRQSAAQQLTLLGSAFRDESRSAFEEMNYLAHTPGSSSSGIAMNRYAVTWREYQSWLERAHVLFPEVLLRECVDSLRAAATDRNGLYLEAHGEFVRLDSPNRWRIGNNVTLEFQSSEVRFDGHRARCNALVHANLYPPK